MNNLDSSAKNEESKIKEEIKNVLDSAIQETEESVKLKKDNKKGNARCTIISQEILDTKVRLCNELPNAAPQPDTQSIKHKKRRRDVVACGTSEWNVEKIKSVEETEVKQCNKNSKISQSIDEMFDLLEENHQRKLDKKRQDAKRKHEIRMEKQMKKKKQSKKKKKLDEENEDENIPDLGFKNFNPKPILDEPLDEATTAENVERNKLTHLKETANAGQEPVKKLNNREMEIDPDKYLNIKPKYLMTQLPDVTGEGEDALDNSEQEEETHRMMSEAFADDDVVEEFRKEKEEEVRFVGKS